MVPRHATSLRAAAASGGAWPSRSERGASPTATDRRDGDGSPRSGAVRERASDRPCRVRGPARTAGEAAAAGAAVAAEPSGTRRDRDRRGNRQAAAPSWSWTWVRDRRGRRWRGPHGPLLVQLFLSFSFFSYFFFIEAVSPPISLSGRSGTELLDLFSTATYVRVRSRVEILVRTSGVGRVAEVGPWVAERSLRMQTAVGGGILPGFLPVALSGQASRSVNSSCCLLGTGSRKV